MGEGELAEPPKSGYWRTNSFGDEGERLELLEQLSDGRTRRLLDQAGLRSGLRCAELGAGAGSVARFLAERVGSTGSVEAIDRDVTLLREVGKLDNVTVTRADLETVELGERVFDLIHTRNLLMHVPGRDMVLSRLAAALNPGGVLVLEEGDGFPMAGATHEVVRRTFAPMQRRWTWARRLPMLLSAEGLTPLEVEVGTDMLQGGTPLAAFWHHTLRTARHLTTENGGSVAREDLEATLRLMEEPAFWSPLMAIVCVTARRPPDSS